MFDHLSIGVRDLARAKCFYDAVLPPLGYACLSEDAGAWDTGETRSRSGSARPGGRCHPTRTQTSISASPRQRAQPSIDSMSRRSAPEAPTTVRPDCVRTMAPTTTLPSQSTPTGIVSRLIAAVGSTPPDLAVARPRWQGPVRGKSRQTFTIRKGSIAPIPARRPPWAWPAR